MSGTKVNFVAVLISAFAMWIFGAIWYTAFSAMWMEYRGITAEMIQQVSGGSMAVSYGGSLIAYMIMFYVMSHFIHYTGASDTKGGIQTGFWLWLGFIATSMFVINLYAMNSLGLWLLDSLYWLIGLMIGGVILVKMKKK